MCSRFITKKHPYESSQQNIKWYHKHLLYVIYQNTVGMFHINSICTIWLFIHSRFMYSFPYFKIMYIQLYHVLVQVNLFLSSNWHIPTTSPFRYLIKSHLLSLKLTFVIIGQTDLNPRTKLVTKYYLCIYVCTYIHTLFS